MEDKLIKSLSSRLNDYNYKLTPQRRDILTVLVRNADKHFSAEELYREVKKINPDVGLATIYRTLEIFCEINLAHQLDFDKNYRRYELNLEGHHHHHLVCVNCGRIIEFNDRVLEGFEQSLEEEYHFAIVDHRIKFYGLCDDCQRK